MATNVIQNTESYSKSAALQGSRSQNGNLKNVDRPVPSASPTQSQILEITADRIRQRAYEIYISRQGQGSGQSGDADSDWRQAERELREAAVKSGSAVRDRISGAGIQPATGISGRSSPRMFSGG